jgi:hypothetical protein
MGNTFCYLSVGRGKEEKMSKTRVILSRKENIMFTRSLIKFVGDDYFTIIQPEIVEEICELAKIINYHQYELVRTFYIRCFAEELNVTFEEKRSNYSSAKERDYIYKLGKLLRYVREIKKITLKELGEIINYSPSMIRILIERSIRKERKYETNNP